MAYRAYHGLVIMGYISTPKVEDTDYQGKKGKRAKFGVAIRDVRPKPGVEKIENWDEDALTFTMWRNITVYGKNAEIIEEAGKGAFVCCMDVKWTPYFLENEETKEKTTFDHWRAMKIVVFPRQAKRQDGPPADQEPAPYGDLDTSDDVPF